MEGYEDNDFYMNPQFLQIARWMDEHGRRYRFTPVKEIPTTERITQIDNLLDAVWTLSKRLGLDLGRKPTIVYTGDSIAMHPALLDAVTTLYVEVIAAHHMLGLCDATHRAIYEMTSRKVGAPPVNYRVIVDEVFAAQEEENESPFRD